ncbi:hypothetical protein AVEN_233613-1 [Araneus ventricosus]|uniref:Uncharacterized protein n=1 Tax=Araneus ventricosus TaxID=182803 RepID=A0A4Y2SKV5_ARAVE|nr:hypothetical protein AVEN_233613-1 [Araneus ventricosus]
MEDFCAESCTEIQEKTSEVWNHCPGCENPSDKITRGLSVKNLVNDRVWWHGPPWLIQQDTSCVSSYDDSDPDLLSQEISAPLPPDRMEKSQPFEVSGIDFEGPLILKDGSKVYIALFTCAVTRGIHLEFISSLSA